MNHKDTNLCRKHFNDISKSVAIAKNKQRGPYNKYTDKDRYNIGKYTSENEPISAVQTFCLTFSNLKLQDQ